MRSTPLLLLLAACAGPSPREVEAILERLEADRKAGPPAVSWVDEAVRRHPRVLEARARAEAALARAGGAGGWDDPMLFAKAEEVPLRNPVDFNDDRFNALGVSQTLPLFKSALREQVALAEARKMAEEARRAANEVEAEIRRAWADYWSSSAARTVHEKHADIMGTFISAAEVKYSTGKVSRQDVLESQSGLSMLHAEVAESEAKVDEARAMLRELTGRDAPPPPLPPIAPAPALEEVERLAEIHRPELRAAEHAARRAEAARDLASRERWVPDLTAEVMVMQMPGEPDAWGGTLGINLPWFSPRRRAEERATDLEYEAEKRALEGARRTARREVASAHARLRAALRTLEIQEKDLVPRARQTLEVARANYEKEKIDFLRFLEAEGELRRMELEAARAQAGAAAAWADLERAVGTRIGGVR